MACISDMLLIDATYNTVRHKEKEINYDWAMECLRSAMDSYMLPRVIVIDRELAFMKAYDTAFLNAKGLLRK
ncbi:hypothetical protein Tco_0024634 [Tanacetum coccineum]